ncbi:leucine-rich repeat and immunoglobulin-like domain-containing nogo receptor-interacting protein 1 [Diorhabda carinulata]|uniref:leucine-rich repeat and immunoglobulin-like domain-containing nogo receptor-interacting protein 1 n=1 Tax=Diorhabda carinulata TaxID=1163345 RepID=UPI0025A16339|nr:leucine-rich repeat and immunoglobulin-like domain-containing nogo receptor-interacting protein 1 [Diorhabda carinulata]
MEPSTYCGASDDHVHYDNYELIAGKAIKLFEVDGIDENTLWIDMKNCSGSMDEITFSLLPNLQLISMDKCDIKSCSKAFSQNEKLETLHINKSKFPFEAITFEGNRGITTLHIQDIKSPLIACFQHLNKLEHLSLEGCNLETINKEFLTGLDSLKGLSISKCHIKTIETDTFRDLLELEGLDIRDCEISEITSDVFNNLPKLKFLSFHHNKIDSEINLNNLNQLESLQTIHFDINIYRSLLYDNFPNLKNVKIGYDDEENIEDEDIIEMLKSKNISTEYVFCGSIDYNSDEMEECY